MKILITGGTGLVGRELGKKLREKGYDVAILSRSKNKKADIQTYLWDPERNEIETGAIETADYIIHLAGRNLTEKRWTGKVMQSIVDSRVETANLLFSKVKQTGNHLRAYISASAVNYYGTFTSDRIFSEEDPPAGDFLGETCRKWEQPAIRFRESGIRTVIIRTGLVLSAKGGALAKLMTPVSLGVGSPSGNGRQFMPWIHVEDICNIYLKAVEDAGMDGAYNAVAPDHKTNREFMETLARVMKKPFLAPNVPAVLLKILFGKMAGVLLNGSRISSDKIRKAGYDFVYPELEEALSDLAFSPAGDNEQE